MREGVKQKKKQWNTQTHLFGTVFPGPFHEFNIGGAKTQQNALLLFFKPYVSMTNSNFPTIFSDLRDAD
jgi:hypothetical protein